MDITLPITCRRSPPLATGSPAALPIPLHSLPAPGGPRVSVGHATNLTFMLWRIACDTDTATATNTATFACICGRPGRGTYNINALDSYAITARGGGGGGWGGGAEDEALDAFAMPADSSSRRHLAPPAALSHKRLPESRPATALSPPPAILPHHRAAPLGQIARCC